MRRGKQQVGRSMPPLSIGCEDWQHALTYGMGGRVRNGELVLLAWGDSFDQYTVCVATKYTPLVEKDWVATRAVLDVVDLQPAPPRPPPPPSPPVESQLVIDEGSSMIALVTIPVLALLLLIAACLICYNYSINRKRTRNELLLSHRQQEQEYDVFLSYRVKSDSDLAERFYDKLLAR